jgi:hypothetical protein
MAKVAGDRLPVGAQLGRNSLAGVLMQAIRGLVAVLVSQLLLLEGGVELVDLLAQYSHPGAPGGGDLRAGMLEHLTATVGLNGAGIGPSAS